MLKSFTKGLKAVASAEGLGMVAGIFVVLALLAYFGQSPDHLAATIHSKTGR